MKKIIFRHRPGLSMLVAAIIISTVALLLATTAALTGINVVQAGLRQSAALITFAGTEGCLEETLLKLRGDASYAGGGLDVGGVACTVTVTGSDKMRVIRVKSTYQGIYTRDIEAVFDWTDKYRMASWRELMD